MDNGIQLRQALRRCQSLMDQNSVDALHIEMIDLDAIVAELDLT